MKERHTHSNKSCFGDLQGACVVWQPGAHELASRSGPRWIKRRERTAHDARRTDLQ